MRNTKYIASLLAAVLMLTLVLPMSTLAAEKKSIQDESIYDLLIDRFNNGNFGNDIDVDARDDYAFSGGDFVGIGDKAEYISEMGFSIASIGSPFISDRYDGNEVISYKEFEPRFGTEEEFVDMIKRLEKKKVAVIADFPLNGISANHEAIEGQNLPIVEASDGSIIWDANDEKVQAFLKESLLEFVGKYDLTGIRLTYLGDFSEAYINELIDALKAEDENFYVLAAEETTANFDLKPNFEKMAAMREAFGSIDPDSSGLNLFSTEDNNQLLQFDDLIGPRFTQDMVDLRMFPPTRWKVAMTAFLTLPGVPIMPYESEIAVVGKEAPETHPITNFKTDEELYDQIKNINGVRNQSDTLRNGDFELLHNEDGFIVYMRTSDEEKWVIAINNTSETKSFEVDPEKVGGDKRLRAILANDSVLKGKDDKYRIVLDREVAEMFYVDENKGFNTPYLIITILIYTTFAGAVIYLIMKGRKNKQA